ncbi:ADP-ribosylglycohydrolase family protein [Catellatospora methionotrophica]|nr:ADP-ribosylglycohydrolase family protein [Catellatospora methionotrophica]
MLDHPQLLRRAHGCMLMAARADLVTAPVHGATVPDPAQVEAVLRTARAGRARQPQPSAAATQLLILAEHLGRHAGRVHDDTLALDLAMEWPDQPDLAETGTARVLSAVRAGARWSQVAPTVHDGQGSYGSVAAVRAGAVGLLPDAGVGAVAALARRTAGITHTHPLARDAAAATATAVALAARGQPLAPADKYDFLDLVTAQLRTSEFRAALGEVQTLVRHRSAPADAAATVGSGPTALRCVPAALTAFLRHPDDPVAAIRYAMMMGGQVRTVATIVGAVCGARHPDHSLALAARPDVTRGLRIQAAAAALARLATGRRSAGLRRGRPEGGPAPRLSPSSARRAGG